MAAARGWAVMPPKSAKPRKRPAAQKDAAKTSSPAAQTAAATPEPSLDAVAEEEQVMQVIEYKAANNETPKVIATHLRIDLKELGKHTSTLGLC